jgi:hypothetical protein
MGQERINRDRERFEGPLFAFRDTVLSQFPEREEEMLRALFESDDADAILANTDSLLHSPPEVKAEKAWFLHEQGLGSLLEGLNIGDDEEVGFVNELAGVEVVKLIK